MKKVKVLFVCTHNSARSQMAEAFLNTLGGDHFEAHSAGFEPSPLNPLAVAVMNEVGIDISQCQAKSVFDLVKKGELYGYVITVCDAETAQRCPVFSGVTTRLDWSFLDPAAFTGSDEEKFEKTRLVRDAIKTKIQEFIHQQGN